MSDRIHCDQCDAVIPRDVWRLTLRCGRAKADTWHNEDNDRDFCRDCIETHPVLKKIYDEQFPEGERPS